MCKLGCEMVRAMISSSVSLVTEIPCVRETGLTVTSLLHVTSCPQAPSMLPNVQDFRGSTGPATHKKQEREVCEAAREDRGSRVQDAGGHSGGMLATIKSP